MTPADVRNEYLDTLIHIEQAYGKLAGNVGRGHIFSFPDVHKLSEGLFLSAWTYWEGLLRNLLWLDLATGTGSVLKSEVKKFRTKNAPLRLADRVLNHPDHPDRFVEWSEYSVVVKRACDFLADGHRFINPLPQANDIAKLKRIRNAIAHKSDKAWDSFIDLVCDPPFSLATGQRKGITPGRFLYSHQWNRATVMQTSLIVLRDAASTLVP